MSKSCQLSTVSGFSTSQSSQPPNLLPSWLMQVPQKMAIRSTGSSCVTWAKSPLVPVHHSFCGRGNPPRCWTYQEVDKVNKKTNKRWLKIEIKKTQKKNKRRCRWYPKTARRFFQKTPVFTNAKKTLRIAALPAALCQPVPEPWKLRNLSEPMQTWNIFGTLRTCRNPSKPGTTFGTPRTCRNHQNLQPPPVGTHRNLEPWNPVPSQKRPISPRTHRNLYCAKKTIAFCCWGTIICCSANLNEVTIRLWDCFPVKKKQWKVEVSIDPLHKNELL